MYCDLGFHTDLTLGRSAIRFKNLKNLKFNNPIAICDNGNMSQLVKLLSLNKSNIPAVELYVVNFYDEKRTPSMRARFYAFDKTGYESLCKMVYTATSHKYYSPRITVADMILDGDIIVIVDDTFLFIEELPIDKVFVAINYDSDPSDKIYLKYKPIYYYDSYGLTERDINVVSSLSERKFYHNDHSWYYDYVHYAIASFIPDAIKNYESLLHRHNGPIITFSDHYPIFCEDATELFDALVDAGLANKCPQKDDYKQRIDYEKSIIKRMKYENYFLVNWDLINWARMNDIPIGPGRGSAAGSLVAYCLGITKLDPVANGLYFERFLNPDRVSPPDIDTDVDSNDRNKLVDYIKRKYGNDHVSRIITFSELKSKSALKDAARLHEVSAEEINKITALFPPPVFGVTPTLEEAHDVDAIKEWANNHRKVWNEAKDLEGFIRQTGIHAAGVVIGPQKLNELIPVSNISGELVCQFGMSDAEKFGMLKLDLLGLETLCLIKDTLKQLGKSYYSMEDIALDNHSVIKQFALGDTHGIFQFESSDMRKLLIRIKPMSFADIAAATALYRPGPLTSGLTDQYVKNKHSETPEYFFPEFEELLSETYGVFVYQEQVMLVAQVVAGFTLSRADTLRKAIGKKDHNVMTQLEGEFVDGAVSRGYDPEKVGKLWKQILGFADYCFNKSHAYAYTMLSYWAMYLKVMYPNEFAIARLSSNMKSTEDLRNDFYEFKHKVKFYNPCINTSKEGFALYEDGIIIGLGSIKGLGNTSKLIVDNQPYTSVAEVFDKVQIDRSQLTSLIYSGAFDLFEKDKEILLGNLERILKFSKSSNNDIFALFDPGEVFKLDASRRAKVPDEGHMEKACYGFNINHGFVNSNAWLINSLVEDHIVGTITEIKRTKTRKDNKDMAIVTLETPKGNMKALFLGDVYEKHSRTLAKESTYGFKGRFKYDGEEPSLFVYDTCSEYVITVVRASISVTSRNKIDAIKQIISDHSRVGECILGVFKDDVYILGLEDKVYYDESIHTRFKEAGLDVKLEIF